jgi:hypothetical protein
MEFEVPAGAEPIAAAEARLALELQAICLKIANRRSLENDIAICLQDYLTSQCARLPSLSTPVVSRSISTPK